MVFPRCARVFATLTDSLVLLTCLPHPAPRPCKPKPHTTSKVRQFLRLRHHGEPRRDSWVAGHGSSHASIVTSPSTGTGTGTNVRSVAIAQVAAVRGLALHIVVLMEELRRANGSTRAFPQEHPVGGGGEQIVPAHTPPRRSRQVKAVRKTGGENSCSTRDKTACPCPCT